MIILKFRNGYEIILFSLVIDSLFTLPPEQYD